MLVCFHTNGFKVLRAIIYREYINQEMKVICIRQVGEVREDLTFLGEALEGVFGYPYRVTHPFKVPAISYEKDREQYNAEVLMAEVAKHISPDVMRLLGVVDVDLYVPGLNFVFGIAGMYAAIISITRLRPEFYGENKNEDQFKERVLKEAIHELGHTFGLHHCPDKRCVMHFSNSLKDTDIKSSRFCWNCTRIMGRKLSSLYLL
jgi:archaemetzincin